MNSTSFFVKSATIAAISMLALAGSAHAATLKADMSVVVATPMTMTQTQSLDFGAIAVVSGSNGSAAGTITMDPNSGAISDPAAEANGANIVHLNGAQAGEIKVNVGAAEAIPMTVTVPSTATLSDSGAGDDLDVTAITVGTPTVGSGSTGDCSSGCAVTSADNGDLVFPLGATLAMAAGDGSYPNDTYSGQFTIIAAYQ